MALLRRDHVYCILRQGNLSGKRLFTLRLVSRTWCAAAQLLINECGFHFPLKSEMSYLHELRWLTCLNINNNFNRFDVLHSWPLVSLKLDYSCLQHIPVLTTLTSLSCNYHYCRHDLQPFPPASTFPNLISLSICVIREHPSILKTIVALTNLRTLCIGFITVEKPLVIPNYLRNVTKLTCNSIDSTSASHLVQIRELTLTDVQAHEAIGPVIGMLPSLSTLEINGSFDASQLRLSSNLQHLEVSGSFSANQLKLPSGLRSLYIRIDDYNYDRDPYEEPLPINLPVLTTLELKNFCNVILRTPMVSTLVLVNVTRLPSLPASLRSITIIGGDVSGYIPPVDWCHIPLEVLTLTYVTIPKISFPPGHVLRKFRAWRCEPHHMPIADSITLDDMYFTHNTWQMLGHAGCRHLKIGRMGIGFSDDTCNTSLSFPFQKPNVPLSISYTKRSGKEDDDDPYPFYFPVGLRHLKTTKIPSNLKELIDGGLQCIHLLPCGLHETDETPCPKCQQLLADLPISVTYQV